MDYSNQHLNSLSKLIFKEIEKYFDSIKLRSVLPVEKKYNYFNNKRGKIFSNNTR